MIHINFNTAEKICLEIVEGEVVVLDFNQICTALKTKTSKAKRSKNKGTLFNRQISLYYRAYITGTWSTGKNVDKIKVVKALVVAFNSVPTADYVNINSKAKQRLSHMAHFHPDIKELYTSMEKEEDAANKSF